MTMGTSTMASMVEALGMGLPANAAIPAVDSRRKVLCRMAGRRIVEMCARTFACRRSSPRGVRERDHGERHDRRLDQRGRALLAIAGGSA
jgi:dihydroxyacid dehydratase/phosphogluconate dehydratase